MKRSFSAENGEDGTNNRRTGRSGADQVIEVPRGTIVKDADSGRVLLDLYYYDQPKVLLRGGNGGYGNQHFATPTRQAPNYAKPGERGRSMELTLELKSIADVGLVGFPNVGKSTLLSVVTAARPKIANYHFTTLTPNLGMVRQDEYSFVMADIPGLVEGASEGIGLGHDFLRHIERTRMLIHVLDVSGSEGRNPLEDYDTIMGELSAYGDLQTKPLIVAANKTDLPDADEWLQKLRAKLAGSGIPVYEISAVTRKGCTELMRATAALLRTLPEVDPFEEMPDEPELPSTESSYTIEKVGAGKYVVAGEAMDWLIRSVNFGSIDSMNYFHRTLRKLGVIDALREAGINEGDTVSIQDIDFEFTE